VRVPFAESLRAGRMTVKDEGNGNEHGKGAGSPWRGQIQSQVRPPEGGRYKFKG
jgi:hypothetical protein